MKTEKIFAIIIGIGLVFKFLLLWPAANVILVLSLSTLSMLYFPLAFYFFSYKGLSNQNYALSIIGGMLFSTAIIGILFKIMYWPGANEMMIVGLAGSIIILVLVFILSGKKDSEENLLPKSSIPSANILDSPEENYKKHNPNIEEYYKNLKIRSIIVTGITLLLFLTPIRVLISIQHRNDPELVRLKTRSYENPKNEQYREELRNYTVENSK